MRKHSAALDAYHFAEMYKLEHPALHPLSKILKSSDRFRHHNYIRKPALISAAQNAAMFFSCKVNERFFRRQK